jgi:hypothetical protein
MLILFLYQLANGRRSVAGEIKVDNTACKRWENYCVGESGITGSFFWRKIAACTFYCVAYW